MSKMKAREESRVRRESWEEKPGALQGRGGLTFWPLDTGVLVVTEEEAFSAVALVAAHHVDTALLAATVALCTLIYVCEDRGLVGLS